ncbi:MAG: hypothetical protein IJW05_01800 [Lentisphaeria bacterium]|nr:hypothetical protein [Lentisphaeria bacterium]
MASDLIYFLNFLLFVFALPLYFRQRWGIRTEISFLPCLILQSVLFYIFAAFHWSGMGFWLIYGGNLLLYLPLISGLFKKEQVGNRFGFLTPGFSALCLMLTVFFLFVRGRECYSWDAISHWMTAGKLFFAEGKLCCEYPPEILSHASYPPGMTMMSMLVQRCFFTSPFREDLSCLGYILPIYGAFAFLFSQVKWGQWKLILSGIALWSCFLPLMRYFEYYFFCYTDFCLAAVMAVVLYKVLTLRKYEMSDLFFLSLLNCWLFMMRNAGWGYSLAVLVLFGILLIVDRRQAFYREDGRCSPGKIFAIFCVFLLPVLLKLSWEYQLSCYGTELRFGGNKISWHGIQEMFGSSGAFGWICLKAFLTKIWSFLLVPVLLCVLGFSAGKWVRDKAVLRGLKVNSLFFSAAAIFFFGWMFLYYLFEFESGTKFPSLARYCIGFFIIPVLTALFLLMDEFGERCAVQTVTGWKKRGLILLCGLMIAGHGYCCVKLLPANYAYRRWRRECNEVLKYSDLFVRGVKFGHISTSGNGFKGFYLQSLFPYEYTKELPEDPVLPGTVKERMYSVPVTPEELRKSFLQVQYVYLDDPKEDFLAAYRSVFADGFEPELSTIRERLFQVAEDGKLKPLE